MFTIHTSNGEGATSEKGRPAFRRNKISIWGALVIKLSSQQRKLFWQLLRIVATPSRPKFNYIIFTALISILILQIDLGKPLVDLFGTKIQSQLSLRLKLKKGGVK